jgi:hypothetical protein
MNKTLLQILSLIVIFGCGLMSNCKTEDPSPEEAFLKKLSGTWKPGTISVDNTVLSGAFDGYTITFSNDKSFTTTGGNDPIWPASGSFTLAPQSSSTTAFGLNRSDGVTVNVSSLEDQKLVMKFQYIPAGGRRASVSGIYTFDLVKK